MQENSYAFFHLDDYANGTSLPAAPVLLKGWAVAKPGFFVTDLRVKLSGRIYPVFYGHPRRDLALYFKAREPHLLAGFEVEVALLPGENPLEFEACEISGSWRPLAIVTLRGTPCAILLTSPTGTVLPHEFARALRLTLQRSVHEPLRQAATSVAGLLPLPNITRYPALPFHGHLHHPPTMQRAEFGRVIVEGWLFHEKEKIRRVAATVDLQAWQVLEHGGNYPYVAGLFPQFPHAAASRIHGSIDVPSQLPQPLSLRVYAELPDGTWHLCHVQRNYFYDDEQHKAPYLSAGAFSFARGVHFLRTAFRQRGLTVTLNKFFLHALREIWRENRARAVRENSPAPARSDRPSLLPAAHPVGPVVLFTHNLNLEGAPLFLLEYARHLAGLGTPVTVISAGDGPLRARFSELGISVRIIDITPLLQAGNANVLRRALHTLAAQIDLSSIRLVVANTLSVYWGIHLARIAGKPSLFYIHESTTPDAFYSGYMAPETLPVVKEAFALATQVSFLTAATRRYYQPQLVRLNHSINPGWIDLARIDRFRAENPREKLRAQLGLAPAARLVINVGTVCNRKGQHIFARAVDLLWRRHPDLAQTGEFLMIGGRHTPYDEAINGLVGYLDRPNLRVMPETPTPEIYYGAADVFVCSSYEESFPRVLLEAMAFGVPIVSTNVHGIPEITRPEQEAILVNPGDSSALALAMRRMLADDQLAQSFAARARTRVAEHFDAVLLLPQHAGLAAEVAAGHGHQA
jgi:glycosyltransferase involved in cell wall biosynthesis